MLIGIIARYGCALASFKLDKLSRLDWITAKLSYLAYPRDILLIYKNFRRLLMESSHSPAPE